ncbi:hypothetical protein PAXRUDRAFT_101525, partial [Paxillus rubicundulus Ve08.2h10]
VTGLSIRHISEHFQQGNETISKYFKKRLLAFIDPHIYNKYVCLPHVDDPTPPEILNNPKFYPFFCDLTDTINGMHITCCPSAPEWDLSHNQK